MSRYAGKRPVGAFGLWDKIKLNTAVDRFAPSWRGRLLERLGRMSVENIEAWWEAVDKLTAAERGGIRPDATDEDICAAADLAARDMAARLKDNEAVFIGDARAAALGPEFVQVMNVLMCRNLLDRRGMLDLWPEGPTITRSGALGRLCDPKWWRGTLRKLHSRTVESCAVTIGLVHESAGKYVSNDGLKRRIAQNVRNAAAMESVTAVNDLGQDAILADLAAKGPSNKAIRRCELLTRIAGFELIQRHLGHVGYMVTITCPSHFHRMTTRKKKKVDNRKWDHSNAREAQGYLVDQWALCRSAAQRAGLEWYGFRIAEPQHDSTPHWHVLLFFAPQTAEVVTERINKKGVLTRTVKPGGKDAVGVMKTLISRYFLDNDSPNEAGAQAQRLDFKWMDPRKGNACAYAMKYVSKNIDGHGVGRDLYGEDAIQSSIRVEAWAGTWGIRQFQQIGGPPIGVWRELRRVNPDNVEATMPEPLRVCIKAVNESKPEVQGELDFDGERAPSVSSMAWMRYASAQGGVTCKRKDMRLRLLREDKGQWASLGRYGEVMPPRVIGVDAAGVQLFRNHIHQMNPAAPPFQRLSYASVESERCAWVVVHGDKADARRIAAEVFKRSGAAASTRIHVNNCTGRDLSRVSEWAPVRAYAPRLRRFAVRPTPPDTVAAMESEHA